MSLDDRAVNEHVFEVELVRQRLENAPEDAGECPSAEALEDVFLVAEALRQVAPRRSRPYPAEDGFQKPPVVRRGDAGIGRLSGQHVSDRHSHGVGQHRHI